MFTCERSQIVALGLFLVRIRWFSEQNLDAITTEAIRAMTGAVTLVSTFSVEKAALKIGDSITGYAFTIVYFPQPESGSIPFLQFNSNSNSGNINSNSIPTPVQNP